MVDPLQSLSARTLAILALVMFAPVVVSFGFGRAWWVDYPGILFHLAMFLLVAKLDAPGWAKAAGFGWLFLDVATGVMTLDHIPYQSAMPVRLGGHIFAGIWIGVTSLSGSRPVRLIGVLLGFIMAGYTFVSPFVPLGALSSTSPLWLLWLILVAWQNGVSRTALGAAAPRASVI